MNTDGNRMQDYLMDQEKSIKSSKDAMFKPKEPEAKTKKELKRKLRKGPKNVAWNKRRRFDGK